MLHLWHLWIYMTDYFPATYMCIISHGVLWGGVGGPYSTLLTLHRPQTAGSVCRSHQLPPSLVHSCHFSCRDFCHGWSNAELARGIPNESETPRAAATQMDLREAAGSSCTQICLLMLTIMGLSMTWFFTEVINYGGIQSRGALRVSWSLLQAHGEWTETHSHWINRPCAQALLNKLYAL